MDIATKTKEWIKSVRSAKRRVSLRSNKAHCGYLLREHSRSTQLFCVESDLNRSLDQLIQAMKDLVEKAERQKKEMKTIKFLAKETKKKGDYRQGKSLIAGSKGE